MEMFLVMSGHHPIDSMWLGVIISSILSSEACLSVTIGKKM